MLNFFSDKKPRKKVFRWKITDKSNRMLSRHTTKKAALTAAKKLRNVKVVPYSSRKKTKRRYY